MLLNVEQSNVHTLLKDTVVLLCKQLVSFNKSLSIRAVVGITTDSVDGFYFDINENIECEDRFQKSEIATQEKHANKVVSSITANVLENKDVRKRNSKTIEENVDENSGVSKEDGDQIHLLSVPPSRRTLFDTKVSSSQHKDMSDKKLNLYRERKNIKRHLEDNTDIYPAKKKKNEEQGNNSSSITKQQTDKMTFSDKTDCTFPKEYETTVRNDQRKQEDETLRVLCSRCNLKFATTSEYKSHHVLHSHCKPFKCRNCQSLVQHNQCNELKCEKCKTHYSCKYKELVCYKCGKKFAGITKLLIHIKSCTGDSTLNIHLLKPDVKPVPIKLFAEPKAIPYQVMKTLELMQPQVPTISTEQQSYKDNVSDISVSRRWSGELDLSINTSQSSVVGPKSPVYSAKPNSLLMNLILTPDVHHVSSPEVQSVKIIEVKPQSPVSEQVKPIGASSSAQLSPFESAQKLLDKVFLKTGNEENIETVIDYSTEKLDEVKPDLCLSNSNNDSSAKTCSEENDTLHDRGEYIISTTDNIDDDYSFNDDNKSLINKEDDGKIKDENN